MTTKEHKELGKIKKVRFGIGGYQDCMLGMQLDFGGDGWGVSSPFYGSWCPGMIDVTEYTKWTEADRTKAFDECMRKLGETLRAAKKNDVSELLGVPVEITFEAPFGRIASWRVLEEVL